MINIVDARGLRGDLVRKTLKNSDNSRHSETAYRIEQSSRSSKNNLSIQYKIDLLPISAHMHQKALN